MSVTTSVYVGASVDGFIARLDGSIDWLNDAGAAAGEDGTAGSRRLWTASTYW